MIRLEINAAGSPIVIQEDFAPTVYLDHWALRKFSSDPMLAKRFTRAIEEREGTLALSSLNLAEFQRLLITVKVRAPKSSTRVFFQGFSSSIPIRLQ